MKSPRRYQTWAFSARRFWNVFLNAVFLEATPLCQLCQRPLYSADAGNNQSKSHQADVLADICLFCLQDMKFADVSQSRRVLRAADGQAIPVIAARRYEGIVRNAIRQWKYDGAISLTAWFADMAVQAWNGRQPAFRPDVVVPVPTSRDRMRKRGYDHVGLLAMALSTAFDLPLLPALQRRPDGPHQFTQSQTAKSAKERLKGLQGKFALDPAYSVQGARVLLVDDIVTTGATLYMCSSCLLEGGASGVQALVIADVL